MHRITWKDWTNTVEKAYQDLARQYSRVFVGGESLGGLLALYLAERYERIAGNLLYAPALKLRGVWRARFIAPFIKTIPKSHSGADPAGHLPWQGYTVLSVPAVNQLRIFQNLVSKELSSIRQPTMIFHGKLDLRIAPRSSQFLYKRISAEKKELILLETTGHTILLDVEREFVYQKTLDFIMGICATTDQGQSFFSKRGLRL
jgi:carboxylesterase